ncbi:hypothetical protein E2493_15900 [Sphingomonas parva]|uniref:Uncharacterized protein n=1 Tax=Sphingomonas parva TaxID=2555898 RepID=A0A4Y8ZPZ3_9SPHN|nr:hypothetical protein [Sphingomonas parva]TFI57195.1 hypothetical protein E2493_15900 [Sphingomonas parva]
MSGSARRVDAPGRPAPARLAIAAWLAFAPVPAVGQSAAEPGRSMAAASQALLPDELVVMKLVWSSLIALDQANQTGNYSVLRDLAAPTFQSRNSAATLAGIFQALRNQRVDLGNALLVTPTFDFAPALVEGGLLRVRGRFPLRPTAIAFDLLYQPVDGQWRLFGIAAVPVANGSPAPPSRR